MDSGGWLLIILNFTLQKHVIVGLVDQKLKPVWFLAKSPVNPFTRLRLISHQAVNCTDQIQYDRVVVVVLDRLCERCIRSARLPGLHKQAGKIRPCCAMIRS